MAIALLALGRGAEARTLAAAAHDACLAAFGPDHRRTTEARELPDRIKGAWPARHAGPLPHGHQP